MKWIKFSINKTFTSTSWCIVIAKVIDYSFLIGRTVEWAFADILKSITVRDGNGTEVCRNENNFWSSFHFSSITSSSFGVFHSIYFFHLKRILVHLLFSARSRNPSMLPSQHKSKRANTAFRFIALGFFLIQCFIGSQSSELTPSYGINSCTSKAF